MFVALYTPVRQGEGMLTAPLIPFEPVFSCGHHTEELETPWHRPGMRCCRLSLLRADESWAKLFSSAMAGVRGEAENVWSRVQLMSSTLPLYSHGN